MDQVQVHVVEAEPIEAALERAQCCVTAVVTASQLRGDERLLAGQLAGANRVTELGNAIAVVQLSFSSSCGTAVVRA